MILLLTLAGRNEEFLSEYKLPRYLLPWGDGTILSAVLDAYLKDGAFNDVRLVAHAADEAYIPHVRAIARARGIGDEKLTLTPGTRGQAGTAAVGIDALAAARGDLDAPVIVANIDTILLNRNMKTAASALRDADGFIDVFRSSNRAYSYVLLDDEERVREIAEKVVVSDVATSGCYGFRSSAVYREYYRPADDRYVSAVFKRMLGAGCRVVTGPMHHESDTVVLSTPEQYVNAALIQL